MATGGDSSDRGTIRRSCGGSSTPTPTGCGSSTTRASRRGPTHNMARILGRDLDELVGLPSHDAARRAGPARLRPPPGRDARQRRGRARTSTPTSSARTVRRSGGWSATPPSTTTTARRMGWLHRVTPYTERKELLEALVDARAAARHRPADRAHRQLGVGRRGRPGAVVGRDVPDLRRRAGHDARRTRPTSSCSTPTTGSGPRRSSSGRRVADDEYDFDHRVHPPRRHAPLGPRPWRRRARHRTAPSCG